MTNSSPESHFDSSPERTIAQPTGDHIVDRAGLGTNTLSDVQRVAPSGGTVPSAFATPQIADGGHADRQGADHVSALPSLPASPDAPARAGGATPERTAATTKNINDAWHALNDATTPAAKEAAVQRFRGAVSAADQESAKAEHAAESAVDKAAAKLPGAGPHDFSQSRSDLDHAFQKIDAASSHLTPDQREKVGPEVARWSQKDTTSSSERKKIEDEIGKKYPSLAHAMQQVRQVQEHYAPFYAGGEQVEEQLKSTPLAQQDRSAFQSRIDARQALSFALRSLGRNREADAADKQISSIQHHEAPAL